MDELSYTTLKLDLQSIGPHSLVKYELHGIFKEKIT